MQSKKEAGECPVCGGPTWKGEEEAYEEGEPEEAMELCWNECYYHLDWYGSHHLRVGEREWRWGRDEYSSESSERPSAEIDRAIEAMKAARRSRYKEPEAVRFVAALDRDRFDQDTRRIFADWLEEHGYDDEAVWHRNWTRAWQEGRDHLVYCAAECHVTVGELLEAATAHLESKGEDDEGLYLGHLTPEIMYDTKSFWRAYQAVTGRDTNGDAGDFVRCAC